MIRKSILILFLLIAAFGCDSLFFSDYESEFDQAGVYDAFYNEVDQHFSFFPYLTKDFDSAYAAAKTQLEANPTDENLVSALSSLINFLEDGHTNAFIGNIAISYSGWYDQYPSNQLDDISGYFSFYTDVNRVLSYGILSGLNVGYIKIRTFTGDFPTSYYQAIDTILDQIGDTKGIVIDVRSNGGGNSNNADLIISRFNDEPRLSFRSRRRTGPSRYDFTDWVDKITDVHSGSRYLKPVAVLTNRASFSSTEWFVAGMRTIPHVTIIGDTTGGGSGNPVARELPNGWTMRVSNTQKQLPEGRDYQYTGIYPDIPVWISEEDFNNGVDTILERAIDVVDN